MITGAINYAFNGCKVEYENMMPQYHKDDEHIGEQLIKEDLGYPIPPRKPSDYGFTWGEVFEDNTLIDFIQHFQSYDPIEGLFWNQ